MLREQPEREQSETNSSFADYRQRIENATQENKKLQSKLSRSQLRDSAKDSEVAVVKREVLEKTAAIEQVMRDLQQRQQATLARVKNVATAMVTSCSAPSQIERNAIGPSSPGQVSRVMDVPAFHPGVGLAKPETLVATVPDDFTGIGGSVKIGRVPSMASSPPRRLEAAAVRHASPSPGHISTLAAVAARSPSPGADLAPEDDEHRWFQSLKANLEHFGDVEVFFDNNGVERDCKACLENMGTPYGIRPRKCQHCFHIECLLQWWTEGTCPVCSASFAPDPDRVARPGGLPSPTSSTRSPTA